jgi:predicted MFS family arabinose efflux permease
VHWLARKQPEGALRRINEVLSRIGKSAIDTLPVITQQARTRTSADIFSPALLVTTLIVTMAYFFHITTFYFIIKWAPKIIVDMGFPASSAAGVLVWANLGGALGGALFGVLTMRLGIKPLTIGVMVVSAVMVNLFGRSPADLQMLSLVCAAACFCSNAGIIGMYAIFAGAFPTHARAFGTGFAVGVGRGGAVLSPIIAGFLLNAGSGLPTVAAIMALGSVVAAGVLVFLKFSPEASRGLN